MAIAFRYNAKGMTHEKERISWNSLKLKVYFSKDISSRMLKVWLILAAYDKASQEWDELKKELFSVQAEFLK